MDELSLLGYGPFFSQQIDSDADAGCEPGRVLADLGARLLLGLADGDRRSLLPAPLRAEVAVGDWGLCERLPDGAVLRRVLARRSALSRQAAGAATGEQVLAANVDRVLVIQGLDGDENPRRLERTLVAARASGADAAVLLAKADLCDDVRAAVTRAEAAAPGCPVAPIAALRGEGLDAVRALVPPGTTAVLVGSSGAGKSTLLNALLGAPAEATGPLGADGRGRHTTTRRKLWRLPGGGMLVDGPGIRELQLWDGRGLGEAFPDLAGLAARCRFSDCTHASEPGCEVRAAAEDGRLDPARLASFHKLKAEADALAARHDAWARLAAKREGRIAERAWRALQRRRGR